MNKNRLKGDRRERYVRKVLEKEGWTVVRSGGSLGMFDLIAIHPVLKKVKMIEVKSYKLWPKERQRYLDYGRPYEGTYELSFEVSEKESYGQKYSP